jgi:hypothetical protein
MLTGPNKKEKEEMLKYRHWRITKKKAYKIHHEFKQNMSHEI